MSKQNLEDRFIKEDGQEGRIAELVEPVILELGYRLVRVKIIDYQGHTLQIMAEKEDGTLDIDDCQKITKALNPLLDLSDVIKATYFLEVSSPGIDRPIVRFSEIEKYEGCEVKIELKRPIDGRKRFKGYLDGLENISKINEDKDQSAVSEPEIRLALKLDGHDQEQIIGLKPDLISSIKLILSKYLFEEEAKEESLSENKPKNKKSYKKAKKKPYKKPINKTKKAS